MNTIQKCILIAAAGFVAMMTLFPPFVIERSGANLYGYGFLFYLGVGNLSGAINIPQLLLQFFVLFVVCTLLWFAFKDKKQQ